MSPAGAEIVFVLVVASRLLVPLAIPRYPLPAIVAALVIDAVDQTVFQATGTVPSNYQQYDKALDVYYLAVAYAATMRNWRDPVAFQVGRFLWYYRLVGVVAFESSGARPLLLIFPNTFEYFFIAYEVVRVGWDPRRLSRRTVIGLAAAIWVFIKLPQEWWIHIAELDVTDEIASHGWAVPALVALAAFLGAALMALAPHLPARDWRPTFDVDAHKPARDVAGPAAAAVRSVPFWSSVAEKTVLTSLISVIFATVLDVAASDYQIVVGVAVFVLLNAVLSQALARRGTAWSSTAIQFAAMLALNVGLLVLLRVLPSRSATSVDVVDTGAFLLLISLMITLYDRYRTMRERRLHLGAAAERTVGRSPATHDPV